MRVFLKFLRNKKIYDMPQNLPYVYTKRYKLVGSIVKVHYLAGWRRAGATSSRSNEEAILLSIRRVTALPGGLEEGGRHQQQKQRGGHPPVHQKGNSITQRDAQVKRGIVLSSRFNTARFFPRKPQQLSALFR
jgi:hypothetical protein